ncbi:MAG: twin-arginine translocase subunit TatB [Pseudomonadota bacterium]|jgi:Tat protein translocase TatB subunit
MFGISFSEIVLILIVAIIVLGPQQLPNLAQKLAKFFIWLRKLQNNLHTQLYQQTGLAEIYSVQQQLAESFQQLKQQLDYTQDNSHLNDQLNYMHNIDFLYQPELDFDYQPELFDELDI